VKSAEPVPGGLNVKDLAKLLKAVDPGLRVMVKANGTPAAPLVSLRVKAKTAVLLYEPAVKKAP